MAEVFQAEFEKLFAKCIQTAELYFEVQRENKIRAGQLKPQVTKSSKTELLEFKAPKFPAKRLGKQQRDRLKRRLLTIYR